MCSPAAAIAGGQVALQTFGNYLGQKSQAKAAQETMNAQAKAAITEMNWKIMDLEQERTDAFDLAVAEISNTRLNSLQLNSGVKAAVNETMSGRTADLLVRAAEGDTARAVASIQDNYDRKSNEVDLNRERAVLNTKTYLENLNASAPKMPSRLANFVSFAGDALNAYASVRGSGGSKETKTTTSTTGKTNTPTFKAPEFVSNARMSFTEKNGTAWDVYDLRNRAAGSRRFYG